MHPAILQRLHNLEEKQSGAQVLRDFITQEKNKAEVDRNARDRIWAGLFNNPDKAARDAYLLLWLTRRAIPYNAVSDPLFRMVIRVRSSTYHTHNTHIHVH